MQGGSLSQDGGLPTIARDLHQVIGGVDEDDGSVIEPRPDRVGLVAGGGQLDRAAPGHSHLPKQPARREVPDPLAVWGEEWSRGALSPRQWRRQGLIALLQEEMGLLPDRVCKDDGSPVGGDGNPRLDSRHTGKKEIGIRGLP